MHGRFVESSPHGLLRAPEETSGAAASHSPPPAPPPAPLLPSSAGREMDLFVRGKEAAPGSFLPAFEPPHTPHSPPLTPTHSSVGEENDKRKVMASTPIKAPLKKSKAESESLAANPQAPLASGSQDSLTPTRPLNSPGILSPLEAGVASGPTNPPLASRARQLRFQDEEVARTISLAQSIPSPQKDSLVGSLGPAVGKAGAPKEVLRKYQVAGFGKQEERISKWEKPSGKAEVQAATSPVALEELFNGEVADLEKWKNLHPLQWHGFFMTPEEWDAFHIRLQVHIEELQQKNTAAEGSHAHLESLQEIQAVLNKSDLAQKFDFFKDILGGLQKYPPESVGEGVGKPFFLRGINGERAALFKLQSFEVGAPRNPRPAHKKNMRVGIAPGEGVGNESLAYGVEHYSLAGRYGVLPTYLISLEHPCWGSTKELGAIQKFLPGTQSPFRVLQKDSMLVGVPRDQIDRLNFRFISGSTDAHLGNFLLEPVASADPTAPPTYKLYNIDFGYDFVRGQPIAGKHPLREHSMPWKNFPQLAEPMSPQEYAFLKSIPIEDSMSVFTEQMALNAKYDPKLYMTSDKYITHRFRLEIAKLVGEHESTQEEWGEIMGDILHTGPHTFPYLFRQRTAQVDWSTDLKTINAQIDWKGVQEDFEAAIRYQKEQSTKRHLGKVEQKAQANKAQEEKDEKVIGVQAQMPGGAAKKES